MPAVLTQHSYGKSRIRLTKVTRLADRHEVRELTIEIELEGDFADSYTERRQPPGHPDGHHEKRRLRAGQGASPGIDRRLRRGGGEPLPRQSFPRRSGDRPPRRAAAGADSRRWPRASPCILRQDSRDANQHRQCARDTACASSRAWTTCSSSNRPIRRFAGSCAIATRHFRTPPIGSWPRCSRPTGSTRADADRLESCATHAFARPCSRRSPGTRASRCSRRSTRWATAALDACSEIERITLVMPNQHRILVDLKPFGLENANEVFLATDEPHGTITGTLQRA